LTTENLDPSFLEILMLKGLTNDKMYLVLCSNVFEQDYFDNSSVGKIFNFSKNYIEEYRTLPPREVILNTLNGEDVASAFREADGIEFDISGNYDYLIQQTNNHLKNQAIKKALMDSVNIYERRENLEQVREIIEKALTKDIKVDLGLDYFVQLSARLRKIFDATEQNRVRTYYSSFDELINGGFPPFTLSVICARIHGFKSNTMANFAARQVLHGENVLMLTLEMSEEMFAQRFDSIYSLLDINRMYLGDNKAELIRKLKAIKDDPSRGNLWIKQFPTGAATVRDFRIYIRELILRDMMPSIIYVDYINLMKSAISKYKDLYSSVKSIAEELRALSFEFERPIVSVSQLNREGSFVGFEELDFNYIAESMGLPATCDFMSILGTDENALIYESELHSKIVKNRLGGRVGEIWKSYYDSRTLKMYDENEMDTWIADAQLTGDDRNPFTRQPPGRGRGRTR
jgi:lambda repressor-like predicted transcriptional regulator